MRVLPAGGSDSSSSSNSRSDGGKSGDEEADAMLQKVRCIQSCNAMHAMQCCSSTVIDLSQAAYCVLVCGSVVIVAARTCCADCLTCLTCLACLACLAFVFGAGDSEARGAEDSEHVHADEQQRERGAGRSSAEQSAVSS